MKKINYVKFTLDLLMAVTMVLLFNKRVLGGLTFHEIAGLGLAVAFLTHVLLNVQWVKRVTLKLFDKKLPWGTRFGYLLNLLLLATMTFIMVSGIFVSRVVFPNIQVSNERWFQMLHISLSFFVLALIGIHVGLHWKWVVNVWNKMLSVKAQPWFGMAAKLATVALLLFGGYEMYTTNFVSRLASTGSILTGQTSGGMEGGMKSDRPAMAANGQMPAGGFHRDGGEGFHKEGGEGGGQSVNPLGVITTYTGIMGVFVIITYYLTKLRSRKKARAV
ncbi:DUF4405 domain-containing protein [Ectobacillus ponti]|uniref:DUF4405 domain-containing protein n=1 Tax=Ectobacillus ponti TaxID=2961894 RepID=A0AA41X5H1_9BACI|nr:DUF4405 domain-containing protein [Ectobacillus ponti]MCP8967548.1 DUF4405 domain-containing protein [Ectobacillus ponti]